MKIAIVCDWLVTYAGAEKVLQAIIECLPQADLFAVIDFLPAKDRAFLKGKTVATTFIQQIPFAKKMYRNYLPLMPLAIEQIDVTNYDIVISSSHAVAKGILTSPNQIHISYVHSPIRYAWDLQHQYLSESKLNSGIKGLLAKYFLHKLRLWDLRTANGVDHFIANSHFIAQRIWKTYRREATVIYPPVDTASFPPYAAKDDFYLTASRLVPYKKVELIVEAFSKLPDKKLVVIGDGPDLAKIKKKATNNIEILGFQPHAKLLHYMQRAKAFIFAAEEDFGILPVEAQAAGTPVIAYGKGGALETIQPLSENNPSGIFFPEQTCTAICQAIEQFEKNREKFTVESCVNQAAKFSTAHFKKQFMEFLEPHLTGVLMNRDPFQEKK